MKQAEPSYLRPPHQIVAVVTILAVVVIASFGYAQFQASADSTDSGSATPPAPNVPAQPNQYVLGANQDIRQIMINGIYGLANRENGRQLGQDLQYGLQNAKRNLVGRVVSDLVNRVSNATVIKTETDKPPAEKTVVAAKVLQDIIKTTPPISAGSSGSSSGPDTAPITSSEPAAPPAQEPAPSHAEIVSASDAPTLSPAVQKAITALQAQLTGAQDSAQKNALADAIAASSHLYALEVIQQGSSNGYVGTLSDVTKDFAQQVQDRGYLDGRKYVADSLRLHNIEPWTAKVDLRDGQKVDVATVVTLASVINPELGAAVLKHPDQFVQDVQEYYTSGGLDITPSVQMVAFPNPSSNTAADNALTWDDIGFVNFGSSDQVKANLDTVRQQYIDKAGGDQAKIDLVNGAFDNMEALNELTAGYPMGPAAFATTTGQKIDGLQTVDSAIAMEHPELGAILAANTSSSDNVASILPDASLGHVPTGDAAAATVTPLATTTDENELDAFLYANMAPIDQTGAPPPTFSPGDTVQAASLPKDEAASTFFFTNLPNDQTDPEGASRPPYVAPDKWAIIRAAFGNANAVKSKAFVSSLSIDPATGQPVYSGRILYTDDKGNTAVKGYFSYNPLTQRLSADADVKLAGQNFHLIGDPRTGDIYLSKQVDVNLVGRTIGLSAITIDKNGKFGGNFHIGKQLFDVDPASGEIEMAIKDPKSCTGTASCSTLLYLGSKGTLRGQIDVSKYLKLGKNSQTLLFFDRTGSMALSQSFSKTFIQNGKALKLPVASVLIDQSGHLSGSVDLRAFGAKLPDVAIGIGAGGLQSIATNIGKINGNAISVFYSPKSGISIGTAFKVAGANIPVSLGTNSHGDVVVSIFFGIGTINISKIFGFSDSRPTSPPPPHQDDQGNILFDQVCLRHSYSTGVSKILGGGSSIRVFQCYKIDQAEQTERSKVIFDTYNSLLKRNPTFFEYSTLMLYSNYNLSKANQQPERAYRTAQLQTDTTKTIKSGIYIKGDSKFIPSQLTVNDKQEYNELQKILKNNGTLESNKYYPKNGVMTSDPFATPVPDPTTTTDQSPPENPVLQDVFDQIEAAIVANETVDKNNQPANPDTAVVVDPYSDKINHDAAIPVDQNAPKLEKGDVDGDGKWGPGDVTLMISALLKDNPATLTPAQLLASDVDNDGLLTVRDLRIMATVVMAANPHTGDVDGDGIISLGGDVQRVLNFVDSDPDPSKRTGLTGPQQWLADVNNDGKLDRSDVKQLLQTAIEAPK